MQLAIDHVTKSYGSKTFGLRDINLTLGPGVLGLLGPNGAGKSTLMRILATISRPTAGRVLWNGDDVHQSAAGFRRVLGYLPQDFGVYPNLNPVEFLSYLAALKGLDAKTAKKRIDELLMLVNLTDARKRALGAFSGGMRQRVGIAQALLNDPKVLIVDEPTVGLDPQERVRFRNLLSDLSGERIVLLSTHIVSDIETVATDIAILDRGHLVLHGSPEGLLQEVEGKVWEVVVTGSELLGLRESHLISSSVRRSDGAHVRIVADAAPSHASVQAVTPTLEEAYLYKISAHTPQKPSGAADSVTLATGKRS